MADASKPFEVKIAQGPLLLDGRVIFVVEMTKMGQKRRMGVYKRTGFGNDEVASTALDEIGCFDALITQNDFRKWHIRLGEGWFVKGRGLEMVGTLKRMSMMSQGVALLCIY